MSLKAGTLSSTSPREQIRQSKTRRRRAQGLDRFFSSRIDNESETTAKRISTEEVGEPYYRTLSTILASVWNDRERDECAKVDVNGSSHVPKVKSSSSVRRSTDSSVADGNRSRPRKVRDRTENTSPISSPASVNAEGSDGKHIVLNVGTLPSNSDGCGRGSRRRSKNGEHGAKTVDDSMRAYGLQRYNYDTFMAALLKERNSLAGSDSPVNDCVLDSERRKITTHRKSSANKINGRLHNDSNSIAESSVTSHVPMTSTQRVTQRINDYSKSPIRRSSNSVSSETDKSNALDSNDAELTDSLMDRSMVSSEPARGQYHSDIREYSMSPIRMRKQSLSNGDRDSNTSSETDTLLDDEESSVSASIDTDSRSLEMETPSETIGRVLKTNTSTQTSSTCLGGRSTRPVRNGGERAAFRSADLGDDLVIQSVDEVVALVAPSGGHYRRKKERKTPKSLVADIIRLHSRQRINNYKTEDYLADGNVNNNNSKANSSHTAVTNNQHITTSLSRCVETLAGRHLAVKMRECLNTDHHETRRKMRFESDEFFTQITEDSKPLAECRIEVDDVVENTNTPVDQLEVAVRSNINASRRTVHKDRITETTSAARDDRCVGVKRVIVNFEESLTPDVDTDSPEKDIYASQRNLVLLNDQSFSTERIASVSDTDNPICRDSSIAFIDENDDAISAQTQGCEDEENLTFTYLTASKVLVFDETEAEDVVIIARKTCVDESDTADDDEVENDGGGEETESGDICEENIDADDGSENVGDGDRDDARFSVEQSTFFDISPSISSGTKHRKENAAIQVDSNLTILRTSVLGPVPEFDDVTLTFLPCTSMEEHFDSVSVELWTTASRDVNKEHCNPSDGSLPIDSENRSPRSDDATLSVNDDRKSNATLPVIDTVLLEHFVATFIIDETEEEDQAPDNSTCRQHSPQHSQTSLPRRITDSDGPPITEVTIDGLEVRRVRGAASVSDPCDEGVVQLLQTSPDVDHSQPPTGSTSPRHIGTVSTTINSSPCSDTTPHSLASVTTSAVGGDRCVGVKRVIVNFEESLTPDVDTDSPEKDIYAGQSFSTERNASVPDTDNPICRDSSIAFIDENGDAISAQTRGCEDEENLTFTYLTASKVPVFDETEAEDVVIIARKTCVDESDTADDDEVENDGGGEETESGDICEENIDADDGSENVGDGDRDDARFSVEQSTFFDISPSISSGTKHRKENAAIQVDSNLTILRTSVLGPVPEFDDVTLTFLPCTSMEEHFDSVSMELYSAASRDVNPSDGSLPIDSENRSSPSDDATLSVNDDRKSNATLPIIDTVLLEHFVTTFILAEAEEDQVSDIPTWLTLPPELVYVDQPLIEAIGVGHCCGVSVTRETVATTIKPHAVIDAVTILDFAEVFSFFADVVFVPIRQSLSNRLDGLHLVNVDATVSSNIVIRNATSPDVNKTLNRSVVAVAFDDYRRSSTRVVVARAESLSRDTAVVTVEALLEWSSLGRNHCHVTISMEASVVDQLPCVAELSRHRMDYSPPFFRIHR